MRAASTLRTGLGIQKCWFMLWVFERGFLRLQRSSPSGLGSLSGPRKLLIAGDTDCYRLKLVRERRFPSPFLRRNWLLWIGGRKWWFMIVWLVWARSLLIVWDCLGQSVWKKLEEPCILVSRNSGRADSVTTKRFIRKNRHLIKAIFHQWYRSVIQRTF